jgi:uncharacterized protein (DUF885 family)
MIGKQWSALLLILALLVVAGPDRSWAQSEPEVMAFEPEPISRLSTYVENYYADKEALDREYVLEESAQYYDRMEQFYTRWLERMRQVDYEGLSVDEAVDFLLLRRNIRRDLEEMQEARASFQEVRSTVPFADIIQEFQEKRSTGQDVEGKQLAQHLDSLARSIQQAQQSLEEEGRLSPAQSRRARDVAENLHETLENAYTFYDGYDPDVTWWAEEPYERADTTLANYVSFLEEWRSSEGAYPNDESGIVGDPVGEEELTDLLRNAMIPYTPEELIAIAEKEYAWCMKQMLAASRQLGYGDDWKAALEHVKNSYVEAGQQPEMIHDLATEATRFLEARDLLTIPEMAKETWRMEMMTPERQLINPYFLGGEVIRISYPTNTMDHEAKMMSMRGNNPHFSKATVHHELIAGHHLQGFYGERYNEYRDPFGTPFWTEGWALYWELQLWDKGFPESPEDRIGMLFWRMHRCARIIFSLNYHLGQMSPQEAVNFLVEKVGHEYKNAEAEIRRSVAANYPPLYQAAYLLGGLQIRSMYDEMVVNGDMPVKEFHDTILREGGMPIEMTRYLLKDEKPPKDFETSWEFYEDFDYTDYSNAGQ